MEGAMPDRFGPGQYLPAPAEFPVEWERPAQTRQLWVLDRQHFGHPVLPLAASIWCGPSAVGTNRAMARYQLPVRLEMLWLNGYLYNCYRPIALPPPPVLKAMRALERAAPPLFEIIRRRAGAGLAARYMAHLNPAIGNLAARWANEWLPAIQQHLAFWHGFDRIGASDAALRAHLAESLARIEQLWELHFLIVLPAFVAMSQLEDLNRELFGGSPAGDVFTVQRLVQGVDTSFLQADRALWRLGRQARAMPAVRQALETVPPCELWQALERSTEGQIVVAELRAWLDRYGQRGSSSDGLGDISWVEDPTPVLQHLIGFLRQPERDLDTELRAQTVERAQAVDQAIQRLNAQPAGARTRYLRLLQAAQAASFLSTEHNFWIDQQAMFCMRRVFLELGRRCVVRGQLAAAEDLFFLTLEEAQDLAAGVPKPDLQALLARRKTDHARAWALRPPAFLGTVPLLSPPPEDPLMRAMQRVLGAETLAPTGGAPLGGPALLRGQGASAGMARGRARVARGGQADVPLQPGEVLVAEATMPAWTPLFAIAAAVVTDVGGILCHAAVTAREYGIPAVVGVRNSTAVIRDQQLIEVDGAAGTVRLLESAP
jgi:pyruvate,water dikinase